MNYTIKENDQIKILKSKDYNYVFNKKTGHFQRWGKDLADDPDMCQFGPEILDMEVTTICHGVNNKVCEFCSPPGTKVNTPNGLVNIEKLKSGDEVLSMNVSAKGSYVKTNLIQEVYSREYSGDLIEIETDIGEIVKLTPEHTIVLTDGTEIEARHLKVNDNIVSISEFKKCPECNTTIICGKSYQRYYCSKECYDKQHTRKCLICDNYYTTRSKKQQFCPSCVDWKGSVYHPLYNVFQSMLYRCYNPKRNNYKHYGGKGIRVSKRWRTFLNFVEDMGERHDNYTLDRIDNSKDYSKDNCRWVTIEEQRINRGRFKNTKRKYKGVSKENSKWKAVIRYRSKIYYLGVFTTELEAAKAYNSKVKEFYPDSYKQYINEVPDEN